MVGQAIVGSRTLVVAIVRGTYAGMAEWYTRTTQNRVSQGMRVRVSLPAQFFTCYNFTHDG